MALSTADIIVIVLFFAVIIFIGLYFRKQAGKDITSFFLGGRNLPWWVAGTSMVATTFAADTPLAVTELVNQYGIAGNWLWWNMLAGGMLTAFFFAHYWRRSAVLTDVEFIELRYSGKAASFLRGFRAIYFGLFMNCLIMAWVNLAMMTLLEVFFGFSYTEQLMAVAALMLATALYSGLSGLLGVAVTDVVQFIVAMGGTITLAYLVVSSEAIGGIENLKSNLPSSTLDFIPSTGTDIAGTLSLGIGSFLAFVGIQWWASWYPGAEPGGGGYIAQRIMSTKNERHATLATLFFQFAHYCLRPWPWIIVALCTVVLYPELKGADSRMGYVIAMKDFLPSGVRGLLLAAFFAAYMSTISTHLNWGSSYLVNDFYMRFLSKNNSQKHLIFISRLVTLLVMIIALGVTTTINSISAVWAFIIECGAGLGLVLILRWYWWRVNAWSEIAATIAPFIGYALSKFLFVHFDASWGLGIMEDPKGFIFTILFTTVTWIIVTYSTPPTPQPTLEKFYNIVRPIGWWSPFDDKIHTRKLLLRLAGWACAICGVYSGLFFLGGLILSMEDKILLYGISFVVFTILTFVILNRMSAQKTIA